MNYLFNFFTPGVLLDPHPSLVLFFPGLLIILIIFTAILASGIFLKIYFKNKNLHKYQLLALNKISNFLMIMSIIGYFYSFFAYEGVPYFSMKIILLIWLIALIIMLIIYLRNLLVIIPVKIKKRQALNELKKYIP